MFIYATDIDSRDKLVRLGFTMLKNDEEHSMWVFVVDNTIHFENKDIPSQCIVSDVLTF